MKRLLQNDVPFTQLFDGHAMLELISTNLLTNIYTATKQNKELHHWNEKNCVFDD